MENNILGINIKRHRKKQGLSQERFARVADVPYTSLTKIETRVIKNPSVFLVVKIAKALNVTVEDLANNE